MLPKAAIPRTGMLVTLSYAKSMLAFSGPQVKFTIGQLVQD